MGQHSSKNRNLESLTKNQVCLKGPSQISDVEKSSSANIEHLMANQDKIQGTYYIPSVICVYLHTYQSVGGPKGSLRICLYHINENGLC